MRILVVSSVGGHLTEIMTLGPSLRHHSVTLVVNDEAQLPDFPFERVYRISHAERDWRVLYNLCEAARIIRVEQPDIILSAGAGPAVPVALVGRLAGASIVFVESAAAVTHPTLTGRLMHPLAHRFFYQWSSLSGAFPRGELAPLVLR